MRLCCYTFIAAKIKRSKSMTMYQWSINGESCSKLELSIDGKILFMSTTWTCSWIIFAQMNLYIVYFRLIFENDIKVSYQQPLHLKRNISFLYVISYFVYNYSEQFLLYLCLNNYWCFTSILNRILYVYAYFNINISVCLFNYFMLNLFCLKIVLVLLNY